MRDAFEHAAACFLEAVRHVPAEAWDAPDALGAWTTRQLAAHGLRAFTTVEIYLAAPPTIDRVLADAGEYYRTVLAAAGIHESVAERGRAAGASLTDPVGEAEATVARVLALVASTLDDEPINTPAGQMAFTEYLATRVVEAGVHTLDLQRATGQYASLHADTSAVILATLVELADPIPLISALTGRAALPAGYNVLG